MRLETHSCLRQHNLLQAEVMMVAMMVMMVILLLKAAEAPREREKAEQTSWAELMANRDSAADLVGGLVAVETARR